MKRRHKGILHFHHICTRTRLQRVITPPTTTTQFTTQAGIEAYNNTHRLKFDGEKLRLFLGDKELMNWNGVSGREGYQSLEFQNVKNKGPLPEGKYEVNQDQYYKIGLLDNLISLLTLGQRGNAPGGWRSWGNAKISLIPNESNEMYGRDNFTIHGGWNPGSAGCIDLTRDNDNFMQTFLTIGKDLPLEVNYIRDAK